MIDVGDAGLRFEVSVLDGLGFEPVFDDHIGIWFHAVVFSGDGASYDDNDKLTSFDFSRQSWYDTAHRDTTVVPVPAAVWLFGSALIGLIGLGKRRKAA